MCASASRAFSFAFVPRIGETRKGFDSRSDKSTLITKVVIALLTTRIVARNAQDFDGQRSDSASPPSYGTMSTINPVRIGLMNRLWTRYLTALEVHPIRTKMITSGSLYICGDFVAQFGIEGRTLRRTEDDREQYDVSSARISSAAHH